MPLHEIAFLVPKQRSLTEDETSTSFESWKETMCFSLSLERKYARFLDDLKTWSNSNVVNRGFTDDPAAVEADIRMTAVQKALCLQHILGIVSTYAPVISHTFIKNTALSLEEIFNRLRSHYGFRRTGSRITELMGIQLEPSESRESLWERYYSFFEGNLLQVNGLTHEGGNSKIQLYILSTNVRDNCKSGAEIWRGCFQMWRGCMVMWGACGRVGD